MVLLGDLVPIIKPMFHVFLGESPQFILSLWEDEVMDKIGKALGKFIGFTEVRNMAASSIKQ